MYNMLSIAAVFDFCAEDGILKTFKIVGYLITIIKILIPLLLILLGSIDFGKAVVASDDKAINKAATTLVTRAVAGIIIFFIPTIIHFVVGLVNSWSGVKSEFENCETCMNKTSECDSIRKKACKKSCKAKEGYTTGSIDSDTDTCICK